jgi:chemotaxis protein CheX
MKVEYINPFVVSTRSVFATMLGWEIRRGAPFVKDSFQPHHDVSGVIGLSGKAKGTIVLSLDRDVALAATEAMLGEHPEEIGEEVVDAVGELANMIAGGAKAKLEQFALRVSLPSVITGKSHCVQFPSRATQIAIPFQSEAGPLMVEVGLVELPANESDTPKAAEAKG